MATPTLTTKAARAANKQISLLSIMAKLCHGLCGGRHYYFISPLRPQEKTPSFVVCAPKNVWPDFGETPDPGQKPTGGDVLKLIRRFTGFALPKARLVLRAWASDLATPAELALPAQPEGDTYCSNKVAFTDVKVEPLSRQPLIEYLTSRGINQSLVQQSECTKAHLQQILLAPA